MAIFRFGEFSLDPDRQELRAREDLVTLEPQVFALLTHLVRNRDRVVSKDEIFENIWRGRIVSDGTLNSRINSVRRAVGDTGSEQAIIKTFSRRGFRFVADVEEDDGMPTADEAGRIFERPAVAVLPFENIGGDPEQEYFADGLTDDIITSLSRFRFFIVIARNSSFSYKGSNIDFRQLGQELGARYVIEGSVRKGGDRLRITAQLIEAASGNHLWAERYDGALEDVFDLQDRIT